MKEKSQNEVQNYPAEKKRALPSGAKKRKRKAFRPGHDKKQTEGGINIADEGAEYLTNNNGGNDVKDIVELNSSSVGLGQEETRSVNPPKEIETSLNDASSSLLITEIQPRDTEGNGTPPAPAPAPAPASPASPSTPSSSSSSSSPLHKQVMQGKKEEMEMDGKSSENLVFSERNSNDDAQPVLSSHQGNYTIEFSHEETLAGLLCSYASGLSKLRYVLILFLEL